MNNTKSAKSENFANPTAPVKTSQHAFRYFFVGISVTVFNYALFAILSNLIIKNNDLLWLSNLIATGITTIVAFISHSKITWKDRSVTKHSVIRFFIWNAALTFLIAPALTQFFSIFTPLYEFAYNITSAIHLTFTYEFVLTTGAFVLTSAVIMILNFLFYDRFVFGKKHQTTPVTDVASAKEPSADAE
ncbi:GtrA family protein [Candidatus Saccharibacteria bacterium]|nr:GtrA family protein [Candidatus Saccharibacteria bacterium]